MIRDRPLFDAFPTLSIPWVELGELPTPIQSLAPVCSSIGASANAWVKRDDLSSNLYGGNKVRTLEVLFGDALTEGATHVISTGAFGTNHGAATVLHAPRVGLTPGLVMFPQPPSATALANYELLTHSDVDILSLAHWIQLPFGMAWTRAQRRVRGQQPYVMVPGGATPRGALGYVNAALELAHQVDAGECPAPAAIVLPVGSTCTSAGLLLGMHVAAALGLGWKSPPSIVAVRVTPWPVTSAFMISRLAAKTSALLERLTGESRVRFDRETLEAGLEVDPHELGRGYGHPTSAGLEAISLFRQLTTGRVLELDTTYSAKAGASLIRRMKRSDPSRPSSDGGPWLFWSTKSTAPNPAAHGRDAGGWLGRIWRRKVESL